MVVTLVVNAFLNPATRIRSVHRGLGASCDSQLLEILVDVDIRVRQNRSQQPTRRMTTNYPDSTEPGQHQGLRWKGSVAAWGEGLVAIGWDGPSGSTSSEVYRPVSHNCRGALMSNF